MKSFGISLSLDTDHSRIIKDKPPAIILIAWRKWVAFGCLNAGWIAKAGEPVVLGLAFCYGALAQFCAGMWEFKRDNTFGATAFSSYGVFWMAFALLVTFPAGKIPPASLPPTLGTFLLAWGIFTGYMTLAANPLSRPLLL